MRSSTRWQFCRIAFLMALLAPLAQGQTPAPAPPPPAAAPAAPAKAPASKEQLEQLLAPIALYPDSLLSQVLMASTYPADVADAAKWAKAHPDNKGDAGVKAVQDQPWDPSVQSLAAFPQILDMMGAQPDWVQKLGDAFLASSKDVLDSVQRLRQKAQQAGNLKSTEQQKVVVEQARAAADGDQDRAGATRDGVRAGIQPDGGVRRLAVPVVPALLLPAAAVLLPRRGAGLGHRVRRRRGRRRRDLGRLQLGRRRREHQRQQVQHRQQQPSAQRQPEQVRAQRRQPARRAVR